MKRMTVRLCGDLFDYCKTYGQVVERFEVIARFSMVDEMHSEVCKFTIKESVPIDQLRCNYVSDLIVLRSEGREFTCLAKGTFSDEITRFLQTYGSKIDYPVVFQDDCLTFAMIGSPEDLHAFIADARKQEWGLEILSVCEYNPSVGAIFDVLTPRQKEVLLESYRRGFFDHPRRISAGELAERMGMHKTTLLEHIHKAENRLIGHILEQTA